MLWMRITTSSCSRYAKNAYNSHFSALAIFISHKKRIQFSFLGSRYIRFSQKTLTILISRLSLYSFLAKNAYNSHFSALAIFISHKKRIQFSTLYSSLYTIKKMAEQNYTVLAEHSRKAPVWENFNLVRFDDGTKKAQCKRCGDFLKPESNSTLNRHFETRCKVLKAGGDATQPILDNSGQIWSYDNDLAREMQMKCVIQMALPFGHFDNPHMTNLIKKGFQPRYDGSVSRQTLRRDALKYWNKVKKSMREMFLNLPNKVSLTCDVWSAPYGLPHSYICITAHWIVPGSWQLCKRVITFEIFGSPHSGERQFDIIMRCLQYYNLKNKVISISFDNASNNTACIDRLRLALSPILDGKLFHTRCCAHIINLAVQDGLKHLNEPLTKFRLMLRRIFTRQPKMQNLFRDYCNQVNFKALGPAHDMPVRWNSTWKMMDNLLRQQQYIQAFYNIYYPDNTITNDDWTMIRDFHDILGDFKTATTMLSGVYYPTSPLLLNQLYILSSKIAQYEQDLNFHDAAKLMKAKLIKYFKKIPFTFLCAAALNPYLNVTGVEVLIQQICLSFGLDSLSDTSFSRRRIQQFNNDFHQLFEIYRVNYGGGSQQTPTPQMFSPGSSSSRGRNRQDLMQTLMQSVATESTKKARYDGDTLGEFNQYVRTNFITASSTNVYDVESLDLLEWWKNKQPSFPIMATIALDILTIQASTVASESAFSLSGRIISERRTKLTPKSVECCVCLKDYLDGEDRIQHQTSLENDLEGVEENLAENEADELQSTPSVTDSSDVGSVGDEQLVTDHLDDPTAVTRLMQYNNLEDYNPEQNPDQNPYYVPYNPFNYNPFNYYNPGGGSSGAGPSN